MISAPAVNLNLTPTTDCFANFTSHAHLPSAYKLLRYLQLLEQSHFRYFTLVDFSIFNIIHGLRG